MVIRSPQCIISENRLDKSRILGPNRHDLLNGIMIPVGCAHGIARPVAHSARPDEGHCAAFHYFRTPFLASPLSISPLMDVRWTLAERRHPPGAAKTAGPAAGWTAPGIENMVCRSPQCAVFENRLDKSCPLEPNGHDLCNGFMNVVGCAHRIAWPAAHSARPDEGHCAAFHAFRTPFLAPPLISRHITPDGRKRRRHLRDAAKRRSSRPAGSSRESRKWCSAARNAQFLRTD